MTSDAGVKYLADQLKIKDSAFQMPSIDASQLVWDRWFQKLHYFCSLYATPQHMVLHCLTGHLPADDPVMEGWDEVSAKLTSQETPVQIEHFASHVRTKLFSVRCTRADAYTKLTALLDGREKVPDCKTMARQLGQYYGWVFPENPRGEHAPASKFQVCILVQKTLVRLRSQTGKSDLTQAWANVTFDQSAVYDQYLRQHLHFVPQESDALCDKYIAFALERLKLADEMHAAVHRANGPGTSATVNTCTEPVSQIGPDAGDRKRGRPRQSDRQRPKAPRSGTPGPSQHPRPPAERGDDSPAPAPRKGMKREQVHREWNTPAAFNLEAVCRAAEANVGVTLQQMLQRGISGHCMYCNMDGLHKRDTRCPVIAGGDTDEVGRLLKKRSVFRKAVQARGLAKALREERAPPPRELPAGLARHFR